MEGAISGDSYIPTLSRSIRAHEQQLSGSKVAVAGPSWLPSVGGSSSAAAALFVPPKPLNISLHHLSYVLLRFEALGLPVGRLDEPLPASLQSRRPVSTFSFVSTSDQRRQPRAPRNGGLDADTMSLSSVRSAISRMSISAASTTSSWFGGPPRPPPDPDREVKYLYSAFTKLPALNIIPPPPNGLIEGFDDATTPSTLTPFDIFKNLQLLSLSEVDPRSIAGWDRLSCQLRSLTLTKANLEDAEELLDKQVRRDLLDRQRSASREARQQVDDVDEASGSADPDAAAADGKSSDKKTEQDEDDLPPLPSLAWHFLSNLGFPSCSMTFFPSLRLDALRSLDLSHNLLISIPPSLVDIPTLQSIDLSGNLIEDCRGAREALVGVRTLNLRGNRLESLSGLDSLPRLRRADLRDNAIFEAAEVGRLAQIPTLESIWVKGNPVYDEYPDPRVEMLREFAKEGWPLEGTGTLILDGEVTGYFERGRVAEKLPLGMRLAPAGSRRVRHQSSRSSQSSTPRAEEALTPWSADGKAEEGVTVVAVRHRGGSRRKAGPEALDGQPHEHLTVGESSGRKKPSDRASSSRPGAQKQPRRNRRIVDLNDDDDDQTHSSGQEEVSEAEKLKRKFYAGQERNGSGKAPTSTVKSDSTDQASPVVNDEDLKQAKMATNKSATFPRSSAGGRQIQKTLPPPQQQTTVELRARIEALKRECGEDWLRVLARGDG